MYTTYSSGTVSEGPGIWKIHLLRGVSLFLLVMRRYLRIRKGQYHHGGAAKMLCITLTRAEHKWTDRHAVGFGLSSEKAVGLTERMLQRHLCIPTASDVGVVARQRLFDKSERCDDFQS